MEEKIKKVKPRTAKPATPKSHYGSTKETLKLAAN
jgi:hypothetical protein